MAKRKTEEQIIAVLKESEAGMKTSDLCRAHGDQRDDVLQVEGQVRRHDGQRSPTFAQS
jgi:hypothetical protein